MGIKTTAFIIAPLVLGFAVLGIRPNSNRVREVEPQRAALSSVTDTSSDESLRSASHMNWVYNEKSSPMGGIVRTASTVSLNTLNFDFPYGGTQKAMLTIRKHPSWGTHIYVSIKKGQILCDAFNNDTVRVRFDQNTPYKVTCGEPNDQDSTVIFLNSESTIIENIRKSKKITVELTFYREGVQHLEFDTRDFDPAKVGLNGAGRQKAQK